MKSRNRTIIAQNNKHAVILANVFPESIFLCVLPLWDNLIEVRIK
jgi:hypothetical protein